MAGLDTDDYQFFDQKFDKIYTHISAEVKPLLQEIKEQGNRITALEAERDLAKREAGKWATIASIVVAALIKGLESVWG